MMWKVTLASLGGAVVLAACGSVAASAPPSPTQSAPTPSTAPAADSAIPCKQITALRASLTGLAQMTGHTVSVGRLAGTLTRAEAELAALKGQAGAFSGQANQLSAELS
jgi:hypothetical protein